MQHRILINVIILVAYVLNLPLKHTKVPFSLTTRWKMEPDFGSWQTPDISRSHLYRGTIAWTPPTAIYRAYTVLLQTGCLPHLQGHSTVPDRGEPAPLPLWSVCGGWRWASCPADPGLQAEHVEVRDDREAGHQYRAATEYILVTGKDTH